MRIKDLKLNQWQVVREAHFNNLGDFVVVAGPNGVGKTKIKDAIVHIFQSSGNPPPNCSVVLEATNQDELDHWKTNEISLPQGFFASLFQLQNKRLRSKSKLIQIDAKRNIDSVAFAQLTFNQIGDPAEEQTDTIMECRQSSIGSQISAVRYTD